MSNEQQDQIVRSLEALVHRLRREYEVTYADVIGCIEMVKIDLYNEAQESGPHPFGGAPQ